MARRRSRRAESGSRSQVWIIVVVVIVALAIVGGLIALSSRPSVPAQAVEGVDLSGISQEIVQINDAPGVALGDPEAPVTLVEYSDFSCPHCADLASIAVDPLIEEYVRSGELRIVYKPITFVNPPYSRPAAQAFMCAAEQGKGWEMYEQIWGLYEASGPGAYTQRNLVGQAEAIGLDSGEFRSCYVSAETNQSIQAVLTEAQNIGIQGTPTLYVNGQPFTYRGPEAVYSDVKAYMER